MFPYRDRLREIAEHWRGQIYCGLSRFVFDDLKNLLVRGYNSPDQVDDVALKIRDRLLSRYERDMSYRLFVLWIYHLSILNGQKFSQISIKVIDMEEDSIADFERIEMGLEMFKLGYLEELRDKAKRTFLSPGFLPDSGLAPIKWILGRYVYNKFLLEGKNFIPSNWQATGPI